MDERWKNIPGFDGYQVSNLGRVRSFWKKWGGPKRVLVDEPRILAIRPNNRGKYFIVGLWAFSAQKTFYVHRLVYEVFVGDIPPGLTIDHIDRDRSNNSVENLRIATITQNHWNSGKKTQNSKYKGTRKKQQIRSDGSIHVWWEASIKRNKEYYYLGSFTTEEEAALAYDRKAIELAGDDLYFVKLNLPT